MPDIRKIAISGRIDSTDTPIGIGTGGKTRNGVAGICQTGVMNEKIRETGCG